MIIKSFESFSAGSDVLGEIEDIVLHLGENLGVYFTMLYNSDMKVLLFKLDGDQGDIKLEVKAYHSQLRVSKLMLEDLGYNLFMDGSMMVITVFKDLVTAGIEFLDYLRGVMVESSGESGRNLVSLYKDADGLILFKVVIGFSVDASGVYSYTTNCNLTMGSVLEFLFGSIFYDSNKRSKLDRIFLTYLADLDRDKYGKLYSINLGINPSL
jgi:hypothetical protein